MKRKLLALLLAVFIITVSAICVNADFNLDFDVENGGDNVQDGETAEPYFAGLGTEASPYIITTSKNLTDLSTLVNSGNTVYSNAYYSLANDIDMTGIDFVPIGGAAATITLPDSTQKNVIYHFGGYFDGNGYSIRNVNITSTVYRYTGFFGYGKNASVENLRLENLTITVDSNDTLFAGALFGVYDGDINGVDLHIKNCYINSDITVSSSTKICAGGIVGCGRVVAKAVIIENCLTDMTINADSDAVIMAGGIMGEIKSGVDIGKCVITGAISTNSLLHYAGSVVGFAKNNTYYVTGDTDWVALEDDVVFTSDEAELQAGNDAYTKIHNIVASVSLDAEYRVGNIIAYAYNVASENSYVETEKCYYDSQYKVVGTIDSVSGTGMTNSALFDKVFLAGTVGLDFARVWKIVDGVLELASYSIDYSLNGDIINVTLDGVTSATVFAAPYSGGRIGTVKVVPYTGVTVPVSFSGVEYDYVVLIVLDNAFSSLCEPVTVD